MLADTQGGAAAIPVDDYAHPLDALVPDPAGKPPICGAESFTALLDGMAADEAPGLFAIFEEYGDRVDARIAGWGMAFEDHAEVVSVDRSLRMLVTVPEDALPGFTFGSHIKARLVWVKPECRTPDEGDDD
jgi:hypothetical protein